ncbi:MAG: sigma-70 family RNA polymerase sigma factor [Sedimentisphaerales bacterium]|nr:sigma-70 family RNA polymerase sigma factor [Sedimentisphaerales bacterium]
MAGELQKRLVEAAVAGDLGSFGELATRYYSSMVAVAYSVVADHQLAEDAAQEAFAKALVGLRKLKKPARFAAWLAQICRNTAVDMVRARARAVPTADIADCSEIAAEQVDTEAVREVIAELSRTERELITLRYYNRLSYEQVSDVLGISRAAVNGRLTRTKQKLAKRLKQQGIWES